MNSDNVHALTTRDELDKARRAADDVETSRVWKDAKQYMTTGSFHRPDNHFRRGA